MATRSSTTNKLHVCHAQLKTDKRWYISLIITNWSDRATHSRSMLKKTIFFYSLVDNETYVKNCSMKMLIYIADRIIPSNWDYNNNERTFYFSNLMCLSLDYLFWTCEKNKRWNLGICSSWEESRDSSHCQTSASWLERSDFRKNMMLSRKWTTYRGVREYLGYTLHIVWKKYEGFVYWSWSFPHLQRHKAYTGGWQ